MTVPPQDFVTPDRFGHVLPPPDHGALARQAAARLRTLLLDEGPEHATLLRPFLDSINELIEQAWPASTRIAADVDQDADADDSADDERMSPTQAAAALVIEVEHLEDLMEALRSAPPA